MKENDGVKKTKTQGHPADTKEDQLSMKRKKAAIEPRTPSDTDDQTKERLSGLREDQPGRDRRGDRNSL